MANAQKATLQATGLRTSPNPLTVSQGGLSEASNVIMVRDNIIEQRRGFRLYGTQAENQIKQLMQYKGRLLRHEGTNLDFDTQILNENEQSIFDTFAGSYSEVEPGLRIKSIDANGNFYFTTSDGIKKISAVSADEFVTSAGYITNAGGVKAINGSARIALQLGQTNGFLPEDSTVAYRLVWGIIDANNNLILGTPSDRIIVSDPLMGFLIPDYMHLLGTLDAITTTTTTAYIQDDNYVEQLALSSNNSPSDLQSALIALAQKIDTDILYADTVSAPLTIDTIEVTPAGLANITFSAGDPTDYLIPGSNVTVGGFTTTSPDNYTELNGNWVLSQVNSSTISFVMPQGFTSFSTVVGDSTAYINSFEYMTAIQNVSFNNTTVDLTNYVQSNPVNDNDLSILQAAISAIETRLQFEPDTVITAQNQQLYVSQLGVTTTTNVILDINIPEGVNANYFLQIYRGHTAQATGTTVLSDLTPDDEMQLVYEAFPTAAELVARKMQVLDLLIDEFKGANLYTNPQSGEGILQANDVPPVAEDIALFNNVTYYANTRTRQVLPTHLLGVQNFKAGNILSVSPYSVNAVKVTVDAPHLLSNNDIVYINGTGIVGLDTKLFPATVLNASAFSVPFSTSSVSSVGYWTSSMVAIVNTDVSQNYYFIKEVQESTSIQTVADVADSLNGKYFNISSGQDQNLYYLWYKTSGGVASDPAVVGRKGIEVFVDTGANAASVAKATSNALLQLPEDFFVSVSANVVVVQNTLSGITTDATPETSGFSITVFQQGRGENPLFNEVGLSNSISPAIAVDSTARSFVNVVNSNTTENVYIYYLSGAQTVPGQMQFEARELNVPQFYLVANNASVGASFTPPITPEPNLTITNSVGSPTVVTAAAHGLRSGDQVVLAFNNSIPSIEGVWTATFLSTSTFSVPVSVSITGSTGVMISVKDSVASSDQRKINRIYYSKISQPEAVPSVNFIDVGSLEKKILRIVPLRDSLFVFKDEGVYRISGIQLPPQVDLFDSSCILIAADSIGIANNIIYGWTTQGIQTITEAGIDIASRDIRNQIIPYGSSNYPNFGTLTWGLGYNSENAYIVFTNTSPIDTAATIAYRFCNLTSTWSTFDLTDTCGIINASDDKMYMGAGDVNFIEQERKSFDRTDYADRQYDASLAANGFFSGGASASISNVSNVVPGDVLVQTQYVTVYNFNSLLQKLDNDPSVGVVSIIDITTGLNPVITSINFPFPTASVDTVTNTLLIPNSTFIPNQKIRFSSTGTLPSGLNSTSQFFVINPTLNGFQVGTEANGSPITISTQGSGVHTVYVDNNLIAGNFVKLKKTNSDPVIDGTFSVDTVSNGYTFSITLDKPVTTAGDSGQASLAYFETLEMHGGDDAKIDLLALAAKLDTDPGTTLEDYVSIIENENGTISDILATDPAVIITSAPHGLVDGRIVALNGTNSTPSIDNLFEVLVLSASTFTVPIAVLSPGTAGTFATQNADFKDIQACFNAIINNLNNDSGPTFNNYALITSSTNMEALIVTVDKRSSKITLDPPLQLLVGDLTTYSAIPYSVVYLPETMGDPLNFKQIREATIMFLSKAFTKATAFYSSDLLPEMIEVPFNGDGNGIFGNNLFGNSYFGGGSHAAPFRTYLPSKVQRCRYIVVGFQHRIAREQFGITGVTLTGRGGLSSRAYRG